MFLLYFHGTLHNFHNIFVLLHIALNLINLREPYKKLKTLKDWKCQYEYDQQHGNLLRWSLNNKILKMEICKNDKCEISPCYKGHWSCTSSKSDRPWHRDTCQESRSGNSLWRLTQSDIDQDSNANLCHSSRNLSKLFLQIGRWENISSMVL